MDFVAQSKNKNQGHRQRLREKFLARGLESLNDDEVLELLLTLGTPRKGLKEPARELLKTFGSFSAALEAAPEELTQVHGIGPQNSFAIHFIHSVARRYLAQRLKDKNYLRSSNEVADYLNHSMRSLKREVFKVILLDASFSIIDTKTLSKGTLAANTIYPRKFIKLLLDHHTAAVVIAHNHPSGNINPSQADLKLTRNLFLACSIMNIQLLDHLIIGAKNKPYSFADHGLMAEIKKECENIL